jgi:hypothetical protein
VVKMAGGLLGGGLRKKQLSNELRRQAGTRSDLIFAEEARIAAQEQAAQDQAAGTVVGAVAPVAYDWAKDADMFNDPRTALSPDAYKESLSRATTKGMKDEFVKGNREKYLNEQAGDWFDAKYNELMGEGKSAAGSQDVVKDIGTSKDASGGLVNAANDGPMYDSKGQINKTWADSSLTDSGKATVQPTTVDVGSSTQAVKGFDGTTRVMSTDPGFTAKAMGLDKFANVGGEKAVTEGSKAAVDVGSKAAVDVGSKAAVDAGSKAAVDAGSKAAVDAGSKAALTEAAKTTVAQSVGSGLASAGAGVVGGLAGGAIGEAVGGKTGGKIGNVAGSVLAGAAVGGPVGAGVALLISGIGALI